MDSKLQFIDDLLKKGEYPEKEELRKAVEELFKEMPNWFSSRPRVEINRLAVSAFILKDISVYEKAINYYYDIECSAYQAQKRGGVDSWDLGPGPQQSTAVLYTKIGVEIYLKDINPPKKMLDVFLKDLKNYNGFFEFHTE